MQIELGEKAVTSQRRLSDRESRVRLMKRKLYDRIARWVVAGGGFTIIASILAILLFILMEIAPLFRPAEVTEVNRSTVTALFTDTPEIGADIVALSIDENREVACLLSAGGVVQFISLKTWQLLESHLLPEIRGQKITSVWQSFKSDRFVLGTDHGLAVQLHIGYNARFFEGQRSYRPAINSGSTWPVAPSNERLTDVAFSGDPEESMIIAGISDKGRVHIFQQTKEASLFGEAEVDSAHYQLEQIWTGKPAAVAIDGTMRNLYMGSTDGKIYHWLLSPAAAPEFVTTTKAVSGDGGGITDLQFLLGGRTLIAADSNGGIGAWFLVRDSIGPAGWRLTKIRDLQTHVGSVVKLAPSARGKGFISADADGNLFLHHSTSGRFLAEFSTGAGIPVKALSFAPKANGALTLAADGKLTHWNVDNPHPEASVKSFFGKVWYEGYEEPEYVWQSTGGTDEFEPKLSLVPLLFGSLKGTLYALVIAVPLAIFGALFTSQFMHPGLRNKIKPTVEIMAALPSVVLGFLGGLWLAPRIEIIIPALLLMAVVLPLLTLLVSALWKALPGRYRSNVRPGVESLVLVPVLLFGIWLSLQLNGFMETMLFAGDFRVWLYEQAGMSFDQRNALVVGLVMGFAIIPLIYTISEDAFSNVPGNLVSGSLALGATRWQTALKVVVPTAAAGIFSAVMIGLGRAVGETMIVLMATGNTPIMDWNIFNGFRTLSANIAVEIPEAPLGGTLYRVLFLAAMLLFVITFVVNTAAELVRQRLRRQFQKL